MNETMRAMIRWWAMVLETYAGQIEEYGEHEGVRKHNIEYIRDTTRRMVAVADTMQAGDVS